MIPVLIFVYNRPKHTQLTLEALSRNFGADQAEVIIYSDGAKSQKDLESVNKVRLTCKKMLGFKKIEIIERANNWGLAANIISGVSEQMQKYGSVIVLEDDLITSPGFLKYMYDSLAFYKNSNIFSICAYSPDIKVPNDYVYSTYLSPRIGSWGWASWQEKWNLVDWNLQDFDNFIKSKKSRMKFEIGGDDLSIMLLNQKTGKINSWAVRFTFGCFLVGGNNVYPVKSLIQNSGIDGSGTHMKKSSRYKSKITESVDTGGFCPDNVIRKEIITQFASYYSTSILRKLINLVKLQSYLFRLKV